MQNDIFSKRVFTCFSCLFEREHNWYALGAVELANLPLVIEKEEDVTFYKQLDPNFFKEEELTTLLDKRLLLEEKIETRVQNIPNLNLCICTKCKHSTLWFGKSKLL